MTLTPGTTVFPQTPEAVAQVLLQARAQGLSVVPLGGQTGLVGGTEADAGQVQLSTARMDRILRLDPVERVAVVECGLTLLALQEAAAVHGLEPGIDLAARGSATIGGMVSTNAGGVMAFRYGVMRHRVLGIEAVLPDGRIYSDLTRVVKNAAGYDLKHLFIGAEGTLGIVTKVVLKLEVAPLATASAIFGLPDITTALALVDRALRLGSLRAAEVLWADYIRLTARSQDFNDPALPLDQPIYLLLVLGGTDEAALRAALEDLFTSAGAGASGIIAASQAQERALALLREDTACLYRSHPGAPSYDVSVPLSALGDYAEKIIDGLKNLAPGFRPYVFGHLADGNLHIVLNCAGPLPKALSDAVEQVLYRDLPALGGSFSAEHGVGSKRIGALQATGDPVKLAAMAEIKRLLDGSGLMNPGKVLARDTGDDTSGTRTP